MPIPQRRIRFINSLLNISDLSRPCRVMQGESEKDMKNRYWFTNEDGENVLNDFCGTEKQAVKYAEKQAKILGEDIYINCEEDIVDVAYA